MKPSVKTKSKKEYKKRDHGFARKLDVPTKRIFHSFDTCPSCGGNLGKPTAAYRRQVIDIPVTSVEVIEHVVNKRWCFSCKKQMKPKVNLKDAVMGKQRIGIKLMSLVVFLKETCRQPLAVIKQYLTLLHGVSLCEGALVKLLHRTAESGKTSYDQLLIAI